MAQPDTNDFAQATIGTDPTLVHDGLADFAALADPASIAGSRHPRVGSADRKGDEVVARLRSELQRRARQIEALSMGLASSDANTTHASELASMHLEVKALKQQLDASNRAAREAHDQLTERDAELESRRCDQQQLRRTLERMQQEFEDYSSERARVHEVSSELGDRARSVQMLTEERDRLRRTVASVRGGVGQANEDLQRTRSLLAEARERLVARETDANALRGALVTTQKQAQVRDCEINELKTAISIASETLGAKREELSGLRIERAEVAERLERSTEHTLFLEKDLETDRTTLREGARELQLRIDEIERLQRELGERKAEIERLRARREDQDSENTALRDRLDQSEANVESLSRDLDREQSELASERERAWLCERTLAGLRETLASIAKAVSLAPGAQEVFASRVPVAAEPDSTNASRAEEPLVASLSVEAADNLNVADAVELDAVVNVIPEQDPAASAYLERDIDASTPLVTATHRTDPTLETLPPLTMLVPRRSQQQRPAIFRSWRDQQIAKHLAPLAVSGADDFFARSIEPILEANPGKVIDLLSLGGDDFEFELRVAQNLRRRGRDAFRIHYPELDVEQAAALNHKAGLVGIDLELVPYVPGSAAQMDPTDFRAIMSDGALSRSKEIEPLIEVLRGAVARNTVLVVGEPTGLVPNEVAREIGDRIWQLMPERYKTNALTQLPESSFWNANAASPQNPDLLGLLRAHFKLEDYAAFGHLIDRFVDFEIGPNFDPEDERDRRFIDQIANLDATKLDAGAVEPLYLVARLTSR